MEELRRKVERIIEEIGRKWGIDRSAAREMLHKFICRGACDWFRSRKPPERFELDLTEEQRRGIEAIIRGIMGDVSMEKARRDIHAVLCHPISG
ncbi:hypothetical protein DRP77_00855 [Candidatus Poribacteria bacterium]|nr:MAG: hypothetical protein DRP77_00855 [Candidatus Poribacteria bacterium]